MYMRKACEGSLRRLQTDYVDLYQMHHIAREAPWDALENLAAQHGMDTNEFQAEAVRSSLRLLA
jgi:aryl-alcohol dehydrogenase-like predicted oxidoreductase